MFALLQDTAQLKEFVTEAKKLNEIGGDWDRRNRLKVYEAYYLLCIRDLKGVGIIYLQLYSHHLFY